MGVSEGTGEGVEVGAEVVEVGSGVGVEVGSKVGEEEGSEVGGKVGGVVVGGEVGVEVGGDSSWWGSGRGSWYICGLGGWFESRSDSRRDVDMTCFGISSDYKENITKQLYLRILMNHISLYSSKIV